MSHEMKLENYSDPMRALRMLFAEKLSPLFAEMQNGIYVISERRLIEIAQLFKNKAWNIDLQALSTLGFAGLGGVSQIGSGFAKSAGIEGLEKILEAVGKILPIGGEISKTFIESNNVLLEAELSQLSQHRQPEGEKILQQIANAESKIKDGTSQLGQQDTALYRLVKGG